MWTNEELAFILYNNRSVKGVVTNFIDKSINPITLIKIEDTLEKWRNHYSNDKRMVEVNKKELLLNSEDLIVTKDDLKSLTQLVKENIGIFNESEYEFLINRGIGDETILKWSILGLSSIKNRKDLEILGATCHPILSKVLDDGIENGGIMIPLFEDGQLINCAIRKINSSKSLKYGLSCPDVPIWGLDILNEGDEIWITEGLFDMMALVKMGKKAISCSSAMWTGLQLYKLIEKEPKTVNIFSDNDQVGIRTSVILKNLLNEYNIDCNIYISHLAKDAAEHIFQKERYLSDLTELKKPEELLKNKYDDSFDFLKHLKNRKY